MHDQYQQADSFDGDDCDVKSNSDESDQKSKASNFMELSQTSLQNSFLNQSTHKLDVSDARQVKNKSFLQPPVKSYSITQ